MKKGEAVEFYGMYGYDYQKGNITINESQAAVVRQMFEWYIGGRGMSAIAKRLNEQGVTAYLGGRWTPSRMGDLLANEKLTGNSMLQKFYSTDHLTKQQKRDNGEKPRYFVEGTHGSQ